MELWIRSQDKEIIEKCESLKIRYNVDYKGKEHYYIDDDSTLGYTLGDYKTKERALEVLDEIQKLIMQSSKIWIENNALQPIKQKDYNAIREQVKQEIPILNPLTPLKSVNIETIVYEMPQE